MSWIGAEQAVEFWVDVYGVEVSRAFLEAGGNVYIHDGHIPCNMYIFDETVVIEDNRVDDIELGTAIVTQDEVVWEWALEVFERYKEYATEANPVELVE